MMDAGQEITVSGHSRRAAAPDMQEGDIKPGDAIFFNTGWVRCG